MQEARNMNEQAHPRGPTSVFLLSCLLCLPAFEFPGQHSERLKGVAEGATIAHAASPVRLLISAAALSGSITSLFRRFLIPDGKTRDWQVGKPVLRIWPVTQNRGNSFRQAEVRRAHVQLLI